MNSISGILARQREAMASIAASFQPLPVPTPQELWEAEAALRRNFPDAPEQVEQVEQVEQCHDTAWKQAAPGPKTVTSPPTVTLDQSGQGTKPHNLARCRRSSSSLPSGISGHLRQRFGRLP
jgi:hypothetical protein